MTDINIAGEDGVPPPPRPAFWAGKFVLTHPRRATVVASSPTQCRSTPRYCQFYDSPYPIVKTNLSQSDSPLEAILEQRAVFL